MRASDKRRQVGGVRALGSTRTRRGSALEAGGGPTVSYPLSIDKDGRITLPLETFLDLLAGAVDESTGLVVTPGSTRRIKNKLGESLQMIRGRIEARPTASDVAGLGTAAFLDAATSGDAAAGEVVVGSDSRLSDDRTPAAHTHDWSDVTGEPTTLAGYGIIDGATDVELAAHEGDTTGVHGIADTANLSLVGHTHVAANVTDLGGLATKTSLFEAGRYAQIQKAPGSLGMVASGCALQAEDGTVTSQDTNTRLLQRYATGTVTNDEAGYLGDPIARIGHASDHTFWIFTGASLASIRLWIGLTDIALGATATPTTENVAAISYDSARDGTAFWRMVTCNGSSATVTAAATAIAIGTAYKVRIVTTTSSVLFYIDGTLVGTLTTTLPTATAELRPTWRVTTLTNAGKRLDVTGWGAMIP